MKQTCKHKKIIRAATKVFAKKGFFNARISDIAKESKVADGTIYLYFNNKFDILLRVFDEEVDKLITHVNLLLDKESSAKGKLEIFIANHLEEMKKNRYLAEVIHVELRQTAKIVQEYRKNTFSKYLKIIAAIIEQGQQEGTFRRDVQPDIAQHVVFGALDEISICWHTDNADFNSMDEAAAQITSLFQTGLLTPAI
jgi:Transcriptional regulator